MRRLVLTPRFKRAYRKFTRRDRALQDRIDETLRLIEQDIFDTQLGTHKLSGQLSGLWACSCGFDCRIIFAMEERSDDSGNDIVLLNIGTHDEVYWNPRESEQAHVGAGRGTRCYHERQARFRACPQ